MDLRWSAKDFPIPPLRQKQQCRTLFRVVKRSLRLFLLLFPMFVWTLSDATPPPPVRGAHDHPPVSRRLLAALNLNHPTCLRASLPSLSSRAAGTESSLCIGPPRRVTSQQPMRRSMPAQMSSRWSWVPASPRSGSRRNLATARSRSFLYFAAMQGPSRLTMVTRALPHSCPNERVSPPTPFEVPTDRCKHACLVLPYAYMLGTLLALCCC